MTTRPTDRHALVTGKDGVTVRVVAPLQLETPLTRLRDHRLTDKRVMFVRNNQDLSDHATTEPSPSQDHAVAVTGLVDAPGTLTHAQLAAMPQVETEVVMQCAGNSRAFFASSAPVEGAPWEHGAVANVTFRGVPLSSVLAGFGVRGTARFLTASGADQPAAPGLDDFERSVPLADVRDCGLLALEMNGEPLPAVHGGPVRLILPGFYSVNHVKWLRTLRLSATPTTSHYQTARYRTPKRRLTPGEAFAISETNSEPCWLQKPKSFIWQPLHGERLRAGAVTVAGPAWTNGRHRLRTVEVSLDAGASWHEAQLMRAASPYAWSLWRVEAILGPGEHTLLARACDDAGNSQPLDGSVAWNPRGYAWNGVHKIVVTVDGAPRTPHP